MKQIKKEKSPLHIIHQLYTRGFTLIETLIVILLLGIMATIGFPSIIRGLDKSRLSGASDEIATALEFAQLAALTSGNITRVTIDDAEDSIVVEKYVTAADLLGSETELDSADVEGGDFSIMEHPINRGLDYIIRFSDEDRFKNVEITSVLFGADNYVIFDSLGLPSAGGSVFVKSGESVAEISLDPLSGEVTL